MPDDTVLREARVRSVESALITDCKSLYDTLLNPSVAGAEDRLTAFELILTRGLIRRTSSSVRWVPSELQIADGLTKDVGESADGLRSVIISSSYTIADEEETLRRRAAAKQERLERGKERAKENEKNRKKTKIETAEEMVHEMPEESEEMVVKLYEEDEQAGGMGAL